MNIAIQKAREKLKGKADSLKRSFFLYSMRVLKTPERFPEAELEKFSEVSMLYERADQMWKEFADENHQLGRQEGRQEGHQEGQHETQQKILSKLLQKKFPQTFSPAIQARLEQASVNQLSQWLDQIIEGRFVISSLLETEKS